MNKKQLDRRFREVFIRRFSFVENHININYVRGSFFISSLLFLVFSYVAEYDSIRSTFRYAFSPVLMAFFICSFKPNIEKLFWYYIKVFSGAYFIILTMMKFYEALYFEEITFGETMFLTLGTTFSIYLFLRFARSLSLLIYNGTIKLCAKESLSPMKKFFAYVITLVSLMTAIINFALLLSSI